MALCACYVSTPVLFPIKLAATAFGIVNLVGRCFGILAPLVAEMKVPRPMMFCSAFGVLSLIFALPLKPYTGEEDEQEVKEVEQQ